MTDDGSGGADVPSDDLPDEPLADLAAEVRDGADEPRSSNSDSDLPPLPGETESDRDGPLGDLASRVDRRRGDADAGGLDELFTDQSVADLDVDAIWEQVESGGVEVDPDDVAADDRVVEKAGYCQQCEFFSAPPDVACGNEGTVILELVDTDSFRVRNCPKVAEEERLGDL